MGHDFDELSRRVIGAALAVHRELGPGFLESAYEKALCTALMHRKIGFECQRAIEIVFEGIIVGTARVDLIVDERLIVELKAVEALCPVHFAQLRSYLRATKLHIGLLFNYNRSKLDIRRVLLD
jgi:GxxExxY protein